MDTPYVVYYSGDKGSAELIEYCHKHRIPIITEDIRGKTENLVRLQKLGLNTVPQVFTGNREYIGDFAKAMEFFHTQSWGRKYIAAPEAAQEEPKQA